MPNQLPGIHHVTAITGDVQRNVDFYVSGLGLRFVKKTVNFDVPDTYHLYFGDYLGSPGTVMTFFGWPHLPWRQQGTGQVLSVSFAVPEASLGYWWERLRKLGVEVSRTRRFGADVIGLADPDRIRLELVGEATERSWIPWNDGPVPVEHAIRGFHSVGIGVADPEPSRRFLSEVLGFREIERDGRHIRLATGEGGPHAIADLVLAPGLGPGEEGVGTVHHVAWRALDEAHQRAWRDALLAAGGKVTPVIDRKYFRSIYFREPGGTLFEIATDPPGFTVDEKPEALGQELRLPPQYEARRDRLELDLPPIVVPMPAPPPQP